MNPRDRMAVSLESGVSMSTIRKFLLGNPITRSCENGIRAAIDKLGIKLELSKPKTKTKLRASR